MSIMKDVLHRTDTYALQPQLPAEVKNYPYMEQVLNYLTLGDKNFGQNLRALASLMLIFSLLEAAIAIPPFYRNWLYNSFFLGSMPVLIGLGTVFLLIKSKVINNTSILLMSNVIFIFLLILFSLTMPIHLSSFFNLFFSAIFVVGIVFSMLSSLYSINKKDTRLILLNGTILIILISLFMISVKSFF